MEPQPPIYIPFDRPLEIRDVLHRRTDLSTFVVHLTKETDDGWPAQVNLQLIMEQARIRAFTPMGLATTNDPATGAPFVSAEALKSQRVVCFSETPLEHAHSLFANIAGRQVRLEGFGVAFTKMVARRIGVNPVWYVDMTPGRTWVITEALNRLIREAAPSFASSPISKITPFVEGMGERHEFWWEREWRHVGDLDLNPVWNKTIWLAREDAFDDLVLHPFWPRFWPESADRSSR